MISGSRTDTWFNYDHLVWSLPALLKANFPSLYCHLIPLSLTISRIWYTHPLAVGWCQGSRKRLDTIICIFHSIDDSASSNFSAIAKAMIVLMSNPSAWVILQSNHVNWPAGYRYSHNHETAIRPSKKVGDSLKTELERSSPTTMLIFNLHERSELAHPQSLSFGKVFSISDHKFSRSVKRVLRPAKLPFILASDELRLDTPSFKMKESLILSIIPNLRWISSLFSKYVPHWQRLRTTLLAKCSSSTSYGELHFPVAMTKRIHSFI